MLPLSVFKLFTNRVEIKWELFEIIHKIFADRYNSTVGRLLRKNSVFFSCPTNHVLNRADITKLLKKRHQNRVERKYCFVQRCQTISCFSLNSFFEKNKVSLLLLLLKSELRSHINRLRQRKILFNQPDENNLFEKNKQNHYT